MPNKIRQLRDEKGFTLEQVAEAVDTSVQQLSRLERGERRLTVEWMDRIASALGVAPAALLTNEPPNLSRLVKQPKKLRLRPDEIRLVIFWRTLGLEQQKMIAGYARGLGLEILADDAESRSA
jgi:transcriptional regulator with XRE-family HTH domain